MVTPAEERYIDDESDRDTVPSGIVSVPPMPPAPQPTRHRPWRLIGWATVACVATLLLALCIATTVAFVVDMSWYGGGMYAAGVTLSSAALGALVCAVGFAMRRHL